MRIEIAKQILVPQGSIEPGWETVAVPCLAYTQRPMYILAKDFGIQINEYNAERVGSVPGSE